MKRVFFLLIACVPLLSFAQESKLTHYIDYSAGYTYRAKMSGLEMQLQYGLGVVKHFDVAEHHNEGNFTGASFKLRLDHG